jgi:plasmid stability protein
MHWRPAVSTLTIKGLPEEIHKRLKYSAARHHRSINKEAISRLEENLERTPEEGEELLKRAMQIRASLKGFKATEAELKKAKAWGRK